MGLGLASVPDKAIGNSGTDQGGAQFRRGSRQASRRRFASGIHGRACGRAIAVRWPISLLRNVMPDMTPNPGLPPILRDPLWAAETIRDSRFLVRAIVNALQLAQHVQVRDESRR